jgi:hypothetical protein
LQRLRGAKKNKFKLKDILEYKKQIARDISNSSTYVEGETQ